MREVDIGDLVAVGNAMRGVERVFVSGGPDALQVDALSLAEQNGAYQAVLLDGPHEVVEHLQLSSLRWTLLESTGEAEPGEVAAIAAKALTELDHENTRYELTRATVTALLGDR